MTKNIRRKMLLLLIISLAAIMTACSGGNDQRGANGNGESNLSNNGDPTEESPQPAVNGEIIQIDDSGVLVTAYVTKNDQSYVDAYLLRVNDQTEIIDASGNAIGLGDLKVGARAETWTIGPVAESFPMQATAAKIILLQEDAETQVSRADAVRIAVDAQTEVGGAWSVKEAELDEEKQYWTVVLVHFMYLEEPVTVRIDAENGEILPNIVAENEVFRIYTPAPGTEVGDTFVVEGEARVFEAAFSWFLEDGHAILAEGHEMTDAGAPAWGKFSFEVNFNVASQPNAMLVLYVASAKDGSMQNELIIPLKVQEDLIRYTTD